MTSEALGVKLGRYYSKYKVIKSIKVKLSPSSPIRESKRSGTRSSTCRRRPSTRKSGTSCGAWSSASCTSPEW